MGKDSNKLVKRIIQDDIDFNYQRPEVNRREYRRLKALEKKKRYKELRKKLDGGE